MNQWITILALGMISMTFSCKPFKPEGSGITGSVTWVEGNQMHMILEEGQKPLKKSAQTIQRTLRVFPLMNLRDMKMEDGFFVSVLEKPITEVETDSKGKFSVLLAPGLYTVLTVEEGGLFGNIFDGEGNVMPVTVRENEWTLLDIEINYKAAY
jgi:hypothetical protein